MEDLEYPKTIEEIEVPPAIIKILATFGIEYKPERVLGKRVLQWLNILTTLYYIDDHQYITKYEIIHDNQYKVYINTHKVPVEEKSTMTVRLEVIAFFKLLLDNKITRVIAIDIHFRDKMHQFLQIATNKLRERLMQFKMLSHHIQSLSTIMLVKDFFDKKYDMEFLLSEDNQRKHMFTDCVKFFIILPLLYDILFKRRF
jgi:hypothetical protein